MPPMWRSANATLGAARSSGAVARRCAPRWQQPTPPQRAIPGAMPLRALRRDIEEIKIETRQLLFVCFREMAIANQKNNKGNGACIVKTID